MHICHDKDRKGERERENPQLKKFQLNSKNDKNLESYLQDTHAHTHQHVYKVHRVKCYEKHKKIQMKCIKKDCV